MRQWNRTGHRGIERHALTRKCILDGVIEGWRFYLDLIQKRIIDGIYEDPNQGFLSPKGFRQPRRKPAAAVTCSVDSALEASATAGQ
jgi:hypothetical protein